MFCFRCFIAEYNNSSDISLIKIYNFPPTGTDPEPDPNSEADLTPLAGSQPEKVTICDNYLISIRQSFQVLRHVYLE